MRKLHLWCIPAAFFTICCILNLYGCLTEYGLERCVKPALLPLLCVTTLAYLLEGGGQPDFKKTALLVCGQLFGFAGDTMLLGKGFPFFAGGIGLFLIGHIFYISLFGGQSWKGMRPWAWAAAIPVCLASTAALALGIGVSGVMLLPMGVYGFVLMLLIFSTLAGVLRRGGATWWILLCGALLFTFSDALIAVRNFGDLSPFMSGFGVMSTYLAAQVLLAVGGIRLVRQEAI